ncbi:hypothetical protein AAG906_037023 [Vitis piasezkii]
MYNRTWELVDLPPGAKTIGYYFDTFAPVTRIASIRVLFTLTSIHNLVIHQMDVKTAFLNGDLEEKIYMDQPEGCVVPGKEKKCIYSKYEDNTCVVTFLYVDDMLIFGTSLEVVCETKKFLGSKFDMKDLGEAEVILGIKITRTPNGLKLSQEHYVEKILRKFEHLDNKPVSTPYDLSSQLKKNREHSVAQIEYAQIIGSLMYLINYTRPDISYAVGFSDANWISNSDEMKSTNGYVFILGGSAISWKSAKQTCITWSSMKAELIALEKTSFEDECLRNLLADIPLWTRPTPSVSMRCDSQAAIAKAKSKIFNGKNRHIRLRHNIVL